MNTYNIEIKVNGEWREAAVTATDTLLEVLRSKLDAVEVKNGCEQGDCGTCTVKLNGLTVKSCLILAVEVDGQEVTTLEGMMSDGLTPLQQSFLQHNSFQCGYCAPGMIIAAEDLLETNPTPTDEEIKEALAGNLCRCTGYTPIIDAIKDTIKSKSSGGSHE